jgi:hypothetical protein
MNLITPYHHLIGTLSHAARPLPVARGGLAKNHAVSWGGQENGRNPQS